jgi:streptogramin lyase
MGGAAGTGGAPVVMGIKGPDITITEFAVPTPSSPGAICAGPDGKLWFTHQSTAPSAIGNLMPDGTNFGLIKTSTTNIGPIAITGGPDGNVWYSKQGGVGKSTPAGTIQEYGTPGGGDPGGIIKGPDGNLWFTLPVYDKIGRVTPAGGFMLYNLPGTGRSPADITLGPDQNLWFTEAAATGNRIGKSTASGVVTEYPIPTAASDPRGIAAGPDGNLWFVEHDGHNIGRITPTGAITEFGIPSGGRPTQIAAGPDGNLWFIEPGAINAIGRSTPTGGISEYPIPSANSDPGGITAGPDGNLWFSEKSVNKIARISNLKGGGNIPSAMGNLGTPLGGNVMCTKDTDCIGSGKACGGDVCSAKSTPHVCVLANTGDPGSCNADADCWCAGEGATCDMTSHKCSFTTHGVKPP